MLFSFSGQQTGADEGTTEMQCQESSVRICRRIYLLGPNCVLGPYVLILDDYAIQCLGVVYMKPGML